MSLKNMFKRKPKPNSIPYYIEEVVGYRSKYESGYQIEDGYPPVVLELLLSILISVRAIRGLLSGSVGFLLGALATFILKNLFVA